MQQGAFGRRGVMATQSVPSIERTRTRENFSNTAPPPSRGTGLTESDPITELEMMRFVGPNWQKYQAAFAKWSETKSGFTWCWPAFFFPIAWLLYRKMYMECGLFVLVTTIVSYILDGKGTAGIAAVAAMQAKPFYFYFAERRIRALRSPSEPLDKALQKISDSGEVSLVGGFIGALFYIAVISLIIAVGAAGIAK